MFAELAEFLFSIFLFSQLSFAWWVFPLLLFTPHLSLIAMFASREAGKLVYNTLHHKGLALGLFVVGFMLQLPVVSLAGIVLFGHASFDRLMGLGLMDGDAFTHTHLKIFTSKAVTPAKG